MKRTQLSFHLAEDFKGVDAKSDQWYSFTEGITVGDLEIRDWIRECMDAVIDQIRSDPKEGIWFASRSSGNTMVQVLAHQLERKVEFEAVVTPRYSMAEFTVPMKKLLKK